ncbi:MAG: outer membrane beta-barrel protein [bacterium]|jgi:hypothetical protein
MKSNSKIILFALVFSTNTLYANKLDTSLKVNAYLEAFYNFTQRDGTINSMPDLYVNHRDLNQLSINTAIIDFNYSKSRFRANAGLMTGSYSKYNYSGFDYDYKNIYQLNIGFELSKKHDIWLDAGIMPSHIGTETIIGSDNMTLTRSLNAESTPYYETGLKLSKLSKDKKWNFALFYLNGWQTIRKNNFYHNVFGTSLVFNDNKNTFGWNTILIHDIDARTLANDIIFNNFYYKRSINNKLNVFLGYDIMANTYNINSRMLNWTTATIITSYKFNTKHSIALRAEQYKNYSENLSQGLLSYMPYNIDYLSASINHDYRINNSLMFRSELKYLKTDKVHNEFLFNNYERLNLIFALCYRI